MDLEFDNIFNASDAQSEIWQENPIKVQREPVSKEFIQELRAAGARRSLIEALEREYEE